MLQFPYLDDDHWTLAGYSDKLGSGLRYYCLKNTNGIELMLYDCFGKIYKVRNINFSLKQVEVRGVVMPHRINDKGWLCVTPPVGDEIEICSWDKGIPSMKLNSQTPDIIIPRDRQLRLALPPQRWLKITYG